MTKGQTMICKTLHRKLKLEQHQPRKTEGELRCPLLSMSKKETSLFVL